MVNAYYLQQYISKTLNTTGGIDNSQTADIELPDVTGIDYTKPGIACISYTDPLDTGNAEWITYTSINNTTKKFVGVTRGTEGFSAKAHAKGVTIAFPLSESHINNLNDAVIIGADDENMATGVLDEDDMATNSAVKMATQQSIKAYVDPTQTTTASDATPNPTGGKKINEYQLTALAEAAAFAAPSGTPANGNILRIRIKDDGTSRALTYNAIYRAVGITLPTATTISKTLYIGAIYNSADSKWDCVATVEEA